MNIFNIFKRKIKNLEQNNDQNKDLTSLFELLFIMEGKINNMSFNLIDNIHLEINLYMPEYLIDNTTKNIINKNVWNFSIQNLYLYDQDICMLFYIEIYPIFANKIVDDLIDYMSQITFKHTNYLRKLKLKSLEKYQ